MANNERYTTKQVIAALDKHRGLKARAAKELGCSHSTVTNYAERHPTVAAALSQNREFMTDTAENALYDAAERGEGWAVCFYLKTQAKDRGYIEKALLEHSFSEEAEIVIGSYHPSQTETSNGKAPAPSGTASGT